MSERALTAEERARVCVTMMPYGDWLRGKGHLRDAYDDIERTVASLVRENGDLRAALDGMFPVDERRVLEHQLDEARRLLVEMALPYEALLADGPSRKWIAPQVWRSIEDAVKLARAMVLAAAEQPQP